MLQVSSKCNSPCDHTHVPAMSRPPRMWPDLGDLGLLVVLEVFVVSEDGDGMSVDK